MITLIFFSFFQVQILSIKSHFFSLHILRFIFFYIFECSFVTIVPTKHFPLLNMLPKLELKAIGNCLSSLNFPKNRLLFLMCSFVRFHFFVFFHYQPWSCAVDVGIYHIFVPFSLFFSFHFLHHISFPAVFLLELHQVPEVSIL